MRHIFGFLKRVLRVAAAPGIILVGIWWIITGNSVLVDKMANFVTEGKWEADSK